MAILKTKTLQTDKKENVNLILIHTQCLFPYFPTFPTHPLQLSCHNLFEKIKKFFSLLNL